mmetsp:Transcript_19293/g.48257  ORF Transcript_19293/g.48257 Transcript_19293/m.48257 type:complete len:250 (+) Transcript_19293:557-1306(+)
MNIFSKEASFRHDSCLHVRRHDARGHCVQLPRRRRQQFNGERRQVVPRRKGPLREDRYPYRRGVLLLPRPLVNERKLVHVPELQLSHRVVPDAAPQLVALALEAAQRLLVVPHQQLFLRNVAVDGHVPSDPELEAAAARVPRIHGRQPTHVLSLEVLRPLLQKLVRLLVVLVQHAALVRVEDVARHQLLLHVRDGAVCPLILRLVQPRRLARVRLVFGDGDVGGRRVQLFCVLAVEVVAVLVPPHVVRS